VAYHFFYKMILNWRSREIELIDAFFNFPIPSSGRFQTLSSKDSGFGGRSKMAFPAEPSPYLPPPVARASIRFQRDVSGRWGTRPSSCLLHHHPDSPQWHCLHSLSINGFVFLSLRMVGVSNGN